MSTKEAMNWNITSPFLNNAPLEDPAIFPLSTAAGLNPESTKAG
jgi:hypothetical protein